MKTKCYKPDRTFRLNRTHRTCKKRSQKTIRDVILYPFDKGIRPKGQTQKEIRPKGQTQKEIRPKGQTQGVANTPHLLRPLLRSFRIHSLRTRDLRTVETASDAMYRLRRNIGRTPCLSIGGDHTVSIGSIWASMAMYPDLKVVYFDAHGDINTETSSLTGNKHGMVLSYVLERGFDPTRLLYVGIRCLDPYEIDRIEELGISYVTVGTPDLEGKVERFVGNCPAHISFDVDVLDASIMPWTGLPTRGGLQGEQVWRIMDRIGQVVAIDVAELNLGGLIGST